MSTYNIKTITIGEDVLTLKCDEATQYAAGLMSTEDKEKLDGIADGATDNEGTVTSVTAGTGLTGGTITETGTIALAMSGATAGNYGPSVAVTGSEGNTINVPYITVDTYGRVTSISNTVYTSKDTTYSAATTSANGLMSAEDKTKVDGLVAITSNEISSMFSDYL